MITMKELSSFYAEEMKKEGKTKSFMKKIYENRLEENKKNWRELNVFILTRLWIEFHKWMLTDKYIKKLCYGFEELLGKDMLHKYVDNLLLANKANLK